jgi:hypothetical protein
LAFEASVRPIRDFITSKEHENRKLAELRDSLLPKLMSGEIRVSAGDKNKNYFKAQPKNILVASAFLSLFEKGCNNKSSTGT